MTVDCPLDCVYLQDAHRHEKTPPVDPAHFPNQDVRVTDEFLRKNEMLLLFAARTLLESALDTPGAIDFDVRDALEALIRTYRTLESGVYYEFVPDNRLAAQIFRSFQEDIQDFRKHEAESGLSRTRDADILGILAFLQRLELDRNNGRKRGRAFLDFLHNHFPASHDEPARASSALIIP
jgi:hypothetical protein